MLQRFNHFALNILMLLMLAYFSLTAAWYGAYSNYFFYPIIYELTDIRGGVLENAPNNIEGRSDFVYVSAGHHMKIFAEMMKSLERGGEGLDQITYPSHEGNTRFLTNDELVFMQDIADFINLYKEFFNLMVLLTLCIAGAMVYGRVWPFALTSMYWVIGVSIGLFWLLVKKFGFVSVFSIFHFLIFPAGHKWSFAPNESLLSLLIKVPEMLASLTGVMGFLFLIVFTVLYIWCSKLLKSLISRYR